VASDFTLRSCHLPSIEAQVARSSSQLATRLMKLYGLSDCPQRRVTTQSRSVVETSRSSSKKGRVDDRCGFSCRAWAERVMSYRFHLLPRAGCPSRFEGDEWERLIASIRSSRIFPLPRSLENSDCPNGEVQMNLQSRRVDLASGPATRWNHQPLNERESARSHTGNSRMS
jgi:hypothetical protein